MKISVFFDNILWKMQQIKNIYYFFIIFINNEKFTNNENCSILKKPFINKIIHDNQFRSFFFQNVLIFWFFFLEFFWNFFFFLEFFWNFWKCIFELSLE